METYTEINLLVLKNVTLTLCGVFVVVVFVLFCFLLACLISCRYAQEPLVLVCASEMMAVF